MILNEDTAEARLAYLLDECLSSMKQENSFQVREVDLENMKMLVEFNIVTVPEDDYIGFSGY